MDAQELDEIESRCLAATKGPWQSFIEGRDHLSGDSFIRTGGMDSPDLYLAGGTLQDQDFIAHARQDIPRLVAEVRNLQAQLRNGGHI
jgi:hypothetical protein